MRRPHSVSEYQSMWEMILIPLAGLFRYTPGMIRAWVILSGTLMAGLPVPAGRGQVAETNLRDIVVPYKNCANVPLPKDVDPEGIIEREIIEPTKKDIFRTWMPLIPASERPPSSKKGAAAIELKLSMDGKIGGLRLISRSGEDALARSAWGAITGTTYKPFPAKARARSVTFTIGFTVNVEPCPKEDQKLTK